MMKPATTRAIVAKTPRKTLMKLIASSMASEICPAVVSPVVAWRPSGRTALTASLTALTSKPSATVTPIVL